MSGGCSPPPEQHPCHASSYHNVSSDFILHACFFLSPLSNNAPGGQGKTAAIAPVYHHMWRQLCHQCASTCGNEATRTSIPSPWNVLAVGSPRRKTESNPRPRGSSPGNASGAVSIRQPQSRSRTALSGVQVPNTSATGCFPSAKKEKRVRRHVGGKVVLRAVTHCWRTATVLSRSP